MIIGLSPENPSKVMPVADEKTGHSRSAASTSSKRLIAQNSGRSVNRTFLTQRGVDRVRISQVRTGIGIEIHDLSTAFPPEWPTVTLQSDKKGSILLPVPSLDVSGGGLCVHVC